jgi:hypothetical protein
VGGTLGLQGDFFDCWLQWFLARDTGARWPRHCPLQLVWWEYSQRDSHWQSPGKPWWRAAAKRHHNPQLATGMWHWHPACAVHVQPNSSWLDANGSFKARLMFAVLPAGHKSQPVTFKGLKQNTPLQFVKEVQDRRFGLCFCLTWFCGLVSWPVKSYKPFCPNSTQKVVSESLRITA